MNKLKKITVFSLFTTILFPYTTMAYHIQHNQTANILPSYENQEYNSTINNELEDTEVIYQQPSVFYVTIPKTIILDGITKSANYNVNVKGDIASDEFIVVRPSDKDEADNEINLQSYAEITFWLKDQGKADIKKADVLSTVIQNDTNWNFTEVNLENGTSKSGTVSADGISAGYWTGVFHFSISLVQSPYHLLE